MSDIKVIRKHLVTRRYFDYGTLLETRYSTASSIDDSGTSNDGTDFATKKAAEAHIAEWIAEHTCKVGELSWTLERGSNIERRCDMNPHGLI